MYWIYHAFYLCHFFVDLFYMDELSTGKNKSIVAITFISAICCSMFNNACFLKLSTLIFDAFIFTVVIYLLDGLVSYSVCTALFYTIWLDSCRRLDSICLRYVFLYFYVPFMKTLSVRWVYFRLWRVKSCF